jgi:hypothetical protein
MTLLDEERALTLIRERMRAVCRALPSAFIYLSQSDQIASHEAGLSSLLLR